MTGLPLILVFVLSVVLMIVAIGRWHVHPFIAIMGISLILGLLAGIPVVDRVLEDGTIQRGIMGVIGTGFANAFASVGLVIIFGALIGSILEKTGAAMKLADGIIRLVGRKHPVPAMQMMGWVIAVPVFCDSGFVILNPIRKALVRRMGVSSVAMTFALSSGLYLSHVFMPPTPGPVATATALGAGDNLLLLMGLGLVCSILPMLAGWAYAVYIGRRVKADDELSGEEIRQTYEQLMASYDRMPGMWSSVAPIAVPVLLMAATSATVLLGTSGWLTDVIHLLGTPVMALAVGVLCAFVQLCVTGRKNDFYAIVNDTLKVVGPILFVTAAGAVLGNVIACSDMVNFVSSHAEAVRRVGIFFPFLMAAILKTAQGSSTVAMTTAAGMVAPLLPVLGLTGTMHTALVCMAVGAGAMTVSHANDSYFWVVTNFGGLSADRGYKVQTVGTLILGLTAIVEIYVLNLLV